MTRLSGRVRVACLAVSILLVFAAMAAIDVRAAKAPGDSAASSVDFSLAHLLNKAETISLSEYRGRPVILNFFASWCAPCRSEMTALEAAYQNHAEQGLVIIGVGSMDGERPLMGFILSTGVSFPVVWDRHGNVSSSFGIRGIPTTKFIDRAGKVQATVTGVLDQEQLEARIKTIIPQEP